MIWSQLSIPFINAMVQSMYRYEARLVSESHLLTEAEMYEFYSTYCYL